MWKNGDKIDPSYKLRKLSPFPTNLLGFVATCSLYLSYILKRLSKSEVLKILNSNLQNNDDVRGCLEKYLKTYFKQFLLSIPSNYNQNKQILLHSNLYIFFGPFQTKSLTTIKDLLEWEENSENFVQ